MTKTFGVIIFLLNWAYCLGQKDSALIFHCEKEQIKLNYSASKVENLDLKKTAINFFKSNGHVGISLQDSVLKRNNWHYYYSSEKQYNKIEFVNADDSYFSTILGTADKINSFLLDLENNGFPFAEVLFINQQEEREKLVLNFKIDSGQFMTIGNIVIKSPDVFHQKTIQNMIHIKPGEVYDESKIRAISNILAQNNMYELIRAPELLFLEKSVDLYLTIKKKNASVADGFIGFQQNPENFKLELNGNVNLGLKNGLNRGEIIDFKWQSNPNKSQNLDIQLVYPFVANLPIGIDGKITIQKQDTTFVRNSFFGGVKYLASLYTLGIFAQSENSFLLGENQTNSSNFSAFRRITFGFDGTITPIINRKYLPRIDFKIGAFSLNTDTIKSPTSNSNLLVDVSITQRIKIFKSFYFQNTTRFQDISSRQTLTKNQLFYFGGLKSVRGFYELELNGNHVLSLNNAIIFKPIKQLSFELIYDYSQFHSINFTQTHSGGFGFNIENETNTLSLILANGMIVGNGFNFQNSKLHLGFISRF